MPLFFFNCNQNTICAEICCIAFLLWISTISIKHHLKSISPFGHEDKLNKQLHISSYFFSSGCYGILRRTRFVWWMSHYVMTADKNYVIEVGKNIQGKKLSFCLLPSCMKNNIPMPRLVTKMTQICPLRMHIHALHKMSSQDLQGDHRWSP